MLHRTFAWIALTFLVFIASARSHAQMMKVQGEKGGFVLQNADKFYRDSDRKLIILEGNVQILYGEQSLSCDKATIFEATREIEAEGNLVINSIQARMQGDRARFSYETGEGVIQNGFVRSGNVIFEGRIVRKLANDEYEAESAYYTACSTCPPAWSFTGSRIRAKLNGYAYIKNSVIEFGHFPVFWLPYLIVPLKSDRQSGFLIPGLDFSEGGTAISESFFWAISRSQDATFTLKNYSLRGLKVMANHRYVLTETSGGESNFGFIQDRVFVGTLDFQNHFGTGPIPDKFNRWFFRFQNLYELPEGFVAKADVNLVSDLHYPRDFSDEMPGIGNPALENRFSLTKNTETTHGSIDIAHYTNFLKADPLDDNSDAVHRFPELKYSVLDSPIGETGAYFRVDTNYVNFARDHFGYDDVFTNCSQSQPDMKCAEAGKDGRFDVGTDVIRTGQRFDIQPELSRPFMIGNLVDILPVLSFRHTQYAFDISPGENTGFNTAPYRQYVAGRVLMRTRFAAVYGIDPSTERDTRYRHEFEPEIGFTTLPFKKQTDHSFFGADEETTPVFRRSEPLSNADFDNNREIQFDYRDRLQLRKQITFGINNRLIEKRYSGDTPGYAQIVNFRLSQSYDLDEAERKAPPSFPWSDIAALLDVRMDRFETQTTANYYPYHNVTNTSTRVRVKNLRGDFFETRFEQKFLINEELEQAYGGRYENVGLGLGYAWKYFTAVGGVDFLPEKYTPLTLNARSWTADLTLKPPGDCWVVQTRLKQELTRRPEFKLSFDFIFGGEGTANFF